MNEYADAETASESTSATGALRQWTIDHEDRASFMVLYIGAAVVLSLIISLFWLVVVVAFHLLLEIVRLNAHGRDRVLGEAAWEVKLDVALILIALALAVYIHAVFGVLGLSTAARAAGASARFVVLQRAIRGMLITIDDVLLVARGALKHVHKRKQTTTRAGVIAGEKDQSGGPPESHTVPAPPENRHDPPSWRMRWGALDWTAVTISVVSIGLVFAAPWLTHHSYPSVLHEMIAELHPWPADSTLQGWIDHWVA